MKSHPLSLVLLLVLLTGAGPALAKRPPQDGRPGALGSFLQLVERGGGEARDRGDRGDRGNRGESRARYSMGQAVGEIQRATNGKVLSAEDRGGSYRIKALLPGGKVRIYQIDATTGAGLP